MMIEDRFYEISLLEIKSGKTVPALLARALAESNGDKGKATSIYIKLRVMQLLEQETRKKHKQSSQTEPPIVTQIQHDEEELQKFHSSKTTPQAVKKERSFGAYAGLCFVAWIIGFVVISVIFSDLMTGFYAQATVPSLFGFAIGRLLAKNNQRDLLGIISFPIITFFSAFGHIIGSATKYNESAIVFIISFVLSYVVFFVAKIRLRAEQEIGRNDISSTAQQKEMAPAQEKKEKDSTEGSIGQRQHEVIQTTPANNQGERTLPAYAGLCLAAWIVGLIVATLFSDRIGMSYARAFAPTLFGFGLGKILAKNNKRDLSSAIVFPILNLMYSPLLLLDPDAPDDSAQIVFVVGSVCVGALFYSYVTFFVSKKMANNKYLCWIAPIIALFSVSILPALIVLLIVNSN
jgi:hypothetical protein